MTIRDPYAFGRDTLGPIFALFCYRLYAHLSVYREGNGAALFVARGGLRLGHWYGLFLKAHGLTSPVPTGAIHISRLVVMKAGLKNAPNHMAAQIAAEFSGWSTEDALRCILPEAVWQDWRSVTEEDALRRSFTADTFCRALATRNAAGTVLTNYFGEQNTLLREHLRGACNGSRPKTLLPVDTGWSGSIVAALKAAVPEQTIRALFFGRYNYGRPPPPVFAHIVGLMAEGEGYDPRSPITAVFRHRHLIEGLCEIKWPSATGFRRDENGQCLPETGVPPAGIVAPSDDEPMARGVSVYLEGRGAGRCLDPGHIVHAAAGAARRLQRAIRYPAAAEAPLLTVPVRSADFGKTLLVPVLLPPAMDPEGKQRNIAHSLWTEGQIALEFPWRRRLYQWRCRRHTGDMAPPASPAASASQTVSLEHNMSLSLPLSEHEPILPRLSAAARDLLPVPETAQTTLNVDSMVNFLPLIDPVLEAAQPKAVCEIGMGAGALTRALVPWCRDHGATLAVVDPVASPKTLGMEPPEHVALCPEISERYLEHGPFANVYFVDGDHNHHTVTAELTAIARLSDAHPEEPLVLFLHDVGWPNGRRDMFYGLSTIPATVTEGRLAHGLRMPLLDPADPPEFGLSYEGVMEGIAASDGGPRNGVLTAVEDFVAANPAWAFFWLPCLYGMGVAWRRDRVTEGLAAALADLRVLVDRVRPLAATMEMNRLRLLATLNLSGSIWQEHVDLINQQNGVIAQQKRSIDDARVELALTLADQARRDGFSELVLCGAGGLQGLAPLLLPPLRAAGIPIAGYYDHLPIGALEMMCEVPILGRERLRPNRNRAFIIVSPGYGREIRRTLETAGAALGTLYLPFAQRS
ncbi:hypothetical protein [Azospirillum picis]|uniref:Class I SAM-dependent methyltransferase n=1 Tax=Azospirillum picis TaxID=488438 RepID=A0ABU0MU45_9PROT|nr:hypothetical protein [Azospirillum picis]MBP2303201.1 hypothetical protein [Azospirillum picis]MDQ0536992.1 hypothetical protein [Azospirillum picis]